MRRDFPLWPEFGLSEALEPNAQVHATEVYQMQKEGLCIEEGGWGA